MPGEQPPDDVAAAIAYASSLQEDAEDLYEHAPCGYLSWVPDGTIVRVNETFLRWTGHERDVLVGRMRFSDLLTIGGKLYLETHLGPLLRMQDEVREVALDLRREDGSTLPVLLNSVLRRDERGGPVVIRTTVFDATDRRSYEREILLARRAEQAARERVERLQGLTAKLAAAVDEGEVVAALCHGLADDPGVVDVQVATTVLGDGPPVLRPDAQALATDATVAEALRTGDVASAPAEPEVLAIPLLAAGRAVGVVRVTSAAAGAEDDQRALLLACVAQAAQALARVRLQLATVAAARRAALLAECGRVAGDGPDLTARLNGLLALLVPAVGDAAWVEDAGGTLAVAAAADVAAAAAALAEEDAADGSGTLADGSRWSLASAPLPGRTILRLARGPATEAFDADARALVAEVAERAGTALEVARLSARDRAVAQTLQASLLAGELPEDPRLLIATSYRPAVEGLQVGGDWFDAFHLTDDVIGVVVGDVVGRGVGAAGSMGQLRSAVRALAGARPGPAELLGRLDGFSERVAGAEMATLAYAEIDLTTGRVRYACAGHPPPLLLAPGTLPTLLWEGRSAPLGAAFGAITRAEGEVVLAPGSRVVLYTDGLVERRHRGLDEQLDRLADEAMALRATPLGSFGLRLTDAMLADAEAPDDVCLLALELTPVDELDRELAGMGELGALRDDVEGWLRRHGVDGEDAYAVVLSCSEAVTNAIEHGHRAQGERVRLRARLVGEDLEVLVSDEGTWKPGPSAAHRGRGLDIIRSVMHEVDVVREGGTSVRMTRTVERGSS